MPTSTTRRLPNGTLVRVSTYGKRGKRTSARTKSEAIKATHGRARSAKREVTVGTKRGERGRTSTTGRNTASPELARAAKARRRKVSNIKRGK